MTHEPGQGNIKTPEQLAGDEVRRLRKEHGWSQEELARRMSVYGYDWHQTTVGRTESAERPLRLNEVIHLAALFRVPVTQFLMPVDMTLAQIDDEIERTAKQREELKAQAARLSGFVAAQTKVIEDLSSKHKYWADQLESVTSHLEILRGLRDILARGQGDGQ